jgi:hypothetical protein
MGPDMNDVDSVDSIEVFFCFSRACEDALGVGRAHEDASDESRTYFF